MLGEHEHGLMLLVSTVGVPLGVFLLVAGGIFAGFFLLAIEIAFKRRKEKREKEVAVSRSALVHWRKKIEVSARRYFRAWQGASSRMTNPRRLLT